MWKSLERKDSIIKQHPELNIRKRKIFENFPINNRKTKIICTIGYIIFLIRPSSNSVETMTRMLDAGMNVARLNFSHGRSQVSFKYTQKIKRSTKT
jgi:hypothetical protein